MVVSHIDTATPPETQLHRSLTFQLVEPDEPTKGWTVDRGPTAWATWEEGDVFGQVEPSLPPVRFEANPQGEVVDVIAPVLDDAWLLRVSLRRDGDDLIPVAIELRPRPGAQISARILRTLGFGGVSRSASELLLKHPSIAKHLGEQWGRPVKQPGRGGREDAQYAQWASQYVNALAVAPRRPVAWLIQQAAERGEHVTRGEIAARLTVARERLLLTEAPPGRAGGELTDKAQRLLDIIEGD